MSDINALCGSNTAAMSTYGQSEAVKRRLALLERVEETGNIHAACRELGFARSQYYTWKRRYDAEGEAGLLDRPPIPRSHPSTTPNHVKGRILVISRAHPLWGCRRIEKELKKQGVAVSSPTIQKVLIEHSMGTRAKRCAKLQRNFASGWIRSLSDEQIRACEMANPIFRERNKKVSVFGYRVVLDTLDIGEVPGIGPVKSQVAICTTTQQTWLLLHKPDDDHAAIRIIDDLVIPEIWEQGDSTIVLETPSKALYGYRRKPEGNPFYEYTCGRYQHVYRTDRRCNGYVEVFKRTFLPEFQRMLGEKRKWTMGKLQEAVEELLGLSEAPPKDFEGL